MGKGYGKRGFTLTELIYYSMVLLSLPSGFSDVRYIKSDTNRVRLVM